MIASKFTEFLIKGIRFVLNNRNTFLFAIYLFHMIVRKSNEMGGACGACGGGVCTGFWWGKPEGKRPLGRPRRRWEDNIKMGVQEVGVCGDWLELAQDRDRWRALVSTVMNLRVR